MGDLATDLALVDAALEYRRRGFPVFPIRPESKKPLVKWKPFQRQLPTEATIRRWWERWPDANIAIVTGAVSGIVALDDDGEPGKRSLMALGTTAFTPLVRTPGGGFHQIFRHPDVRIGTRAGVLEKFDVKGDGGYFVAAPSRRPDGGRYEWLTTLDDFAPAPLPDAVLALLLADSRGKTATEPTVGPPTDKIEKGRRNSTLYLLGRSLAAKGLDADAVEAALIAENVAQCVPPLSSSEIRELAVWVATQPNREDFSPPAEAAAEARAFAQKLRSRAATWPWPKRLAANCQRVLKAHLGLMERGGRFAYTAALREVAELSGLPKTTVERTHLFLRSEGWLSLQKGAPRGTRLAATWSAHVPVAAKLTSEQVYRLTLGGLRPKRSVVGHPEAPPSVRDAPDVPLESVSAAQEGHDVWCRSWQGRRGLGAAAGRLYAALGAEPMRPRDLALLLRIRSNAVRVRLAVLERHGLAVRWRTGWRRGLAELDAVAISLGVFGRGDAVSAEHRRQRERFDENPASGWRLGAKR